MNVKHTAGVLLRTLANLRALEAGLLSGNHGSLQFGFADLRSAIEELESATNSQAKTGPEVTERERDVLEYLADFLGDHGYQPSYREIAEYLRLNSTKPVNDVCNALVAKGYLAQGTRGARSLRIVGLRLGVVRTLLPPPPSA
jgi:hypothetical protein